MKATHEQVSAYYEVILGGDPPPDGVEWIREVASDDFFRTDDRTWDCIFVDGDHMRPQATRDTINAMRVLNDDGLLFIHDTYPPNTHPVTLPLWCGLTIVRRVHERRLWTMEEN